MLSVNGACNSNIRQLIQQYKIKVLGVKQSPIQWVPGPSRRYNDRGLALTDHPPLAPRLKEE